jgi:pimeloyl-ACP methyl ester carboxylesterase
MSDVAADLIVRIKGIDPGNAIAGKPIADADLSRLDPDFATALSTIRSGLATQQRRLVVIAYMSGINLNGMTSDPTDKIMADIERQAQLPGGIARAFLIGQSAGGRIAAVISQRLAEGKGVGHKLTATYVGMSDPAFDSRSRADPANYPETDIKAVTAEIVFQSMTEQLLPILPGGEYHGPVNRPNVTNLDLSKVGPVNKVPEARYFFWQKKVDKVLADFNASWTRLGTRSARKDATALDDDIHSLTSQRADAWIIPSLTWRVQAPIPTTP